MMNSPFHSPTVRIGLIGLGNRGLATLKRYMVIDGAQVVALSDLTGTGLNAALDILRAHHRMEPSTFYGEGRWRLICESDEVDLVYICTDWASHAEMAVYAMQRGKHVALEVPAAMTVEECWALVHTAEETHRHCIMLENCCYDTFHLGLLGMQKAGLIHNIAHLEGAYIHDLRERLALPENQGGYHKGWMSKAAERHRANPYPTHALGPVCQLLGTHRGERLVSLVSLTGLRGVNNTLLRTSSGATVLLQYDVQTPRPYSRLQTLVADGFFAQKYPRPCLQTDGREPLFDEDAVREVESHIEPRMRAILNEGRQLGVPNLMNYAMDRRLIDALRRGEPLDMDVYDAAEWSCLCELTELSATQGGTPVDVPRFRG